MAAKPQLMPEPSTKNSQYESFTQQFIGGAWRRGSGAKTAKSVSPWTGETLVELQNANIDDLNVAYESAQKARKAGPPFCPWSGRR